MKEPAILTADMKQAISSALVRLSAKTPFLGTLALFAKVEASAEVPIAATDGRTIFINPNPFFAMSRAEQEGVLLHEVLHAALLHVPRTQGRERERWNIAADIVVNGILLQEGYSLPEGAVIDDKLAKYGVEEVYDLLRFKRRRQQKSLSPEQADLLAERPSDAPPSPGDEQQTSAAMQADAAEHWQNAVEQASVMVESTMHGTMPAYLERELGQIQPSRLDWQHYLWRYLVQTPVDFKGFDRRFVGQGMYLDDLSGERVRVLLAVDTSGSIVKRQLQDFVSEVQGILGAYPHLHCELFYADAKLYGPQKLLPHGPIPPAQGGGGTNFQPFFEYITEAYDLFTPTVAVYLTDGFGRFPRTPPPYPTLWVVTPGGAGNKRFPFGEVVRMVSDR